MYTLRQLWRQFQADKLFALINIAGLTLSISCYLIIFIYVGFHYSFDKFHPDSERIYRLLSVNTNQPETSVTGMVTNALLPAIRAEIPEVELATRFQPTIDLTVRVDDKVHFLDMAYLVDADFFRMFNFPITAGVGGEAMDEPNTLILSQSFAEELFGEEDPIGKVVRLFDRRDMRVVGIMADMPANSHLQVDAVASLRPDPAWSEETAANLDSWLNISMHAYFKLAPGSDPEIAEQKIQQLMAEREESGYISAVIQPLHDAHLYSSHIAFGDVSDVREDYRKIFILIAIAILLLAIAVCNYINLTTAKSVARTREIGIRKVVGANQSQLIKQFLAESCCLILVACLLSFVVIDLISPWMTVASIENPIPYLFSNPGLMVIAFALLTITGLIAGLYPALVLTSQKTVRAIKGNYSKSKRGKLIRRSLVVFQFFMSTTVIIWLLAINGQIAFLQNQSLGFNPEGIINMSFPDPSMSERYPALASELEGIPEIESFTSTSFMPAGGGWGKTGFAPMEGPVAGVETVMNHGAVDASFIETLQMRIILGEDFNENLADTTLNPVILNEAAVRAFQWADSPINKTLRSTSGRDYVVVGVIEQIHFDGLINAIEPLILRYSTIPGFVVASRFSPNTMATGLVKLEQAWTQIYPEYPFTYRVLTDNVAGLLEDEVGFATQLFQFALIAIFIACLGLYGHATFSANQEAKNVGIHKVFGASTIDILKFISKEYGLLLLIANAIAWPAGFLLVELWLSGFAERIDAGIAIYLQSMLIVVVVAAVTIGSKIWEVVRANPVEVLRDE
ncbi:MAG: ABC transporter permease [Gammaproteobacteria bacterium]|nr:ABC transporter permease [Gammaproteobacteria bacterium]